MEAKEPLRLVVLGDSTSFIDHGGPTMPGDPNVYPSIVAAALQDVLERPVDVTVIARPGSDTRDTWRTVTKDQHVMFDVLMGADAVIVGVGSLDHAPTVIPAGIDALTAYVRPARARRFVRTVLRRVHPVGVRVTGGRMTRVPRSEFERFYDGILLQVRALARGAAIVALGPTSHTSSYYGSGHRVHPDRAALHAEVAARHGIDIVQTWPLVEPHRDALNPDGIHWPPAAHAAVGRAAAAVLADQLLGTVAVPPSP